MSEHQEPAVDLDHSSPTVMDTTVPQPRRENFKPSIPVAPDLIRGQKENPRDTNLPEVVSIPDGLEGKFARGYALLNSRNRGLVGQMLSYCDKMSPKHRIDNKELCSRQELFYDTLVKIVSVEGEQLAVILGITFGIFEQHKDKALSELYVLRGIPYIALDKKDRVAFRALVAFFIGLRNEKSRNLMVRQIVKGSDKYFADMAGLRGVRADARERLVAYLSSFQP